MATSETTLLQFVALSLPAVAILMQAILSFQDRYDVNESSTIRTEFRFIELSFIGLVIAGGLFGISLIGTVDSIWGKAGLVSMLLGLSLLAPATWFALRRPKYPSQSYDSPEEAAASGAKYAIGGLFSIGILGATIYFIINIFPLLDFETTPEQFTDSFTGIVIAAVFLTISSTFVQTITYYQQSEKEKQRIQEWNTSVQETISDIDEFLPNEITKPGYSGSMSILVKLEEFEEEIENLISRSPSDVEVNQLREIRTNIEVYKELIDRQHDSLENINALHNQMEALRESLSELEDELYTLPEESERRDEIKEEKENVQIKLSNIESKAEEAKIRQENIQKEMKSLLVQLQENLSNVKNNYAT